MSEARPLVENVDYYWDDGMMVLTAHYLLRRGTCCSNGCRHCPYRDNAPPKAPTQ